MALNISIRSGQFGDDQLTSDHFSSTTQYASFLVDSALTNGNAAVANIADLTALESTIQTAIDSDIDARLGSLVSILGAGITYDAANDTFAFGTITLTSSANATFTDWTSVIEAIDAALKTAETGISTNAGNIAANTGNIATNTADIGTNTGNIADLRGDVDATLGLTVANPSGITGFSSTTYLTANTITSVFGAIEGLDSALNTIEQAMISADQGLQANIDTLESNVESRLGISDITDATAFNQGSSTYLQNALNVSNALTILDAAIASNDTDISSLLSDLAQEITDRTNADTALAGDIATLQTELDNTQASLGFGGNGSVYSSSGTYANNSNVTTDIADLDAAIVALGSAFQYVGTIDVSGAGTTVASAKDITTLTGYSTAASGDYYKLTSTLSQAVYIKGANGTAVQVMGGDAIVFNQDANGNPTGDFDKFDNSDPSVAGTNNEIAVSRGADDVYTVAIDTVFSGRVSTNEGDIASLQTFTGEGTALDTTAGDLAAAINELHGEIVANDGDIAGLNADLTALTGRVTTNEGDIATNASDIGTNAGNIATNTTNIATNASDIASNDTDISALQTEMTTTQLSVGVNADGTLPNYANTNNIANADTHHEAIAKLDAAVQQSSTAPVDTGRLTVAPVSHQYADFARLNDVNDLQVYASKVYDANANNTTGSNTNGYGDLHEFQIPTVAGKKQILVLGSLLANAPTPTVPANSGNSSHLNNNTYWSSVRVYKNGVRLIQRNSSATLQSADEYKVVAVINPANYPATYGDYDTSDEFVRYPIKYGAKVESSWRAADAVSAIGNTDPNAGDSHTLAGQTNTDDISATAHTLSGTAHPNAGEVRYYKVEFGGVLNTQDIITVDYMGLKD